jgi:hypothetical protein
VRKKIITVVAAGALGVSGLAVAGPALAAAGAPDAAAAVTSRVDKVKQALAGLVTDGTLTQTQADKVATTLGSAPDAGWGPGGHRGFGGGADLSAAATTLGMSEADLRTALRGGKSLAQVAKDKGVAVDKLVAALVQAEKDRVAADVTAGRLTQAQADQRLADVTARVTDRVDNTRPDRGPRDHAQPGESTPAPALTG